MFPCFAQLARGDLLSEAALSGWALANFLPFTCSHLEAHALSIGHTKLTGQGTYGRI
jgi:hypothetical protein